MYMASTVLDTMAAVESVEGSVVTTIAVAADTALLYDTTMLMVTATDPDGLSVTQEAMVRVAASDYEVWDDFLITDQAQFVFAGLGLRWMLRPREFPVRRPGIHRPLERVAGEERQRLGAGAGHIQGARGLRLHGPARRTGRHLSSGGRCVTIRPLAGTRRRLPSAAAGRPKTKRRDQQLTPPKAGAPPHTAPRLTPAHKTAPPPPSRRSRRGYSAPASSRTSTARPPSAPTARPPTRSDPGPCPRAASAR